MGSTYVSGSYDNMRWLNTEFSSVEISRFSSELFLYYLFTLGDLKLYLIVFSGVKLLSRTVVTRPDRWTILRYSGAGLQFNILD